ncbi:hypothetical protein DYB32_010604, partial [Aphanomyces invadans]
MGIQWMRVYVNHYGTYHPALAVRILSAEWADGIRKEFQIARYYSWMVELPILDSNTLQPRQCLICGGQHQYMACPELSEDSRDRVQWVWGWVRMQYLRDPKIHKYYKKHEKLRNVVNRKLRRIYADEDFNSVATLNGVLEVPFCADSGSDVNIISMEMLEALQAKDTKVQSIRLSETWKGFAVESNPVYSDQVVKIRIRLQTAAGPVNLPGIQPCYVISKSDALLVSRPALESIGINMDRLLEQVATHQRQEGGDDVGEPDGDEDIAFGVATPRLQNGNNDLDNDDLNAAKELHTNALETLKLMDDGNEAILNKLETCVMNAAREGVWRIKFRGTDAAANVPAMEIKLKSDARPHRCKARKTSPLETKFLDAFGRQLEEDGIIYSNSSSAYCSP